MPIPFEDVPQMRPALRQVFFLLLDGIPLADIAKTTGTSERSVHTLASRVTTILKKSMPDGIGLQHCVAREFMRQQDQYAALALQRIQENTDTDLDARFSFFEPSRTKAASA